VSEPRAPFYCPQCRVANPPYDFIFSGDKNLRFSATWATVVCNAEMKHCAVCNLPWPDGSEKCRVCDGQGVRVGHCRTILGVSILQVEINPGLVG
jgi:hypothetical protein